ncbi:hypothetical protein C7B77_14240 [Chamaesiphon polymorphus CCALA 037]|uniref:Uncharacterized protein n=1 Tax=Chamaesiphon polymorphus CCALA 037 TaxID=2107692 RepID=A0A2T1GE33_9CYAN|nr:hypothetical protein C7B77_14240 [Chamaesiphon polymorphus CCALA 037]
MEQLTDIESLSIRARVAYLLCLTESVLSEIKSNIDGYLKAQHGLEKCWDWLSEKSPITGEDLC